MRDISDPEKQKLNINQRTFSICVVKELVCLELHYNGLMLYVQAEGVPFLLKCKSIRKGKKHITT